MTGISRSSTEGIHKKESLNMVLFSVGKFVSIFGSSVYTFAMGLYVLKSTGSGLSFATTLVLSLVPMLMVSPLAGVLADKINRKKMVVSMDFLCGMLLMGLYFLSGEYGLRLMMIYISNFMLSMFTTIFNISIEAGKPNMVSENKLININSISNMIDSGAMVLGPMVGGLSFAIVDIKLFILFNGISFIGSGISEMFIDFRFNDEEPREERQEINFIKDIKAGFEYMIGHQQIMDLLWIFIVLNFALGLSLSVPLPFIINTVFKLSPGDFGMIQSGFSVGLIMGAALVGTVNKYISYNKLLIAMKGLLAIAIIMIGLPVLLLDIIWKDLFLLIYYSMLMGVIGIAISFIDIPVIYILQKIVSYEYRGRVLSLVMGLAKAFSPIAFILSGVFINNIPPYILQGVGGGILLVSFINDFRNNKWV